MRYGIRDTEPAIAWPDAFLAGNGRHGAMAYGNPRDESVIVTHHHLVAPNGSAELVPPSLAARLAEVRDLLLAGKSSGALDRFCAGWPENAPQPFHPAFAVRLRLAGDRGALAGCLRTADFSTGLLTTTWRDAAGRWRRTCFVSRARDVVVQRLELPPGAADATLEISHEVFLPGTPAGLAVSWQAQRAGGGVLLSLSAEYPDPAGGPGSRAGGRPAADGSTGRAGGFTGATRMEARGGDWALDGARASVRGARHVLLLTRVARVPASAGSGAPAEALARSPAGALTAELSHLPADYGLLLAEHARLHRRAFGRTHLDLGASRADRHLPVTELLRRQAADPAHPHPALLEKLFDSGRYLLLCSSGLLPPRLPGVWQGDWHAAWSGAIVTNANLNLQLAGAVTTDVPAAIHAVADLVGAQLADWRVNASRLYGARGILAPAATDGSSGLIRHFAAAYPHHMWTAGADWLLVPLLDYVDATGDERFLRERVRPALTELALFYEDFLAGADHGGDLVFVPSYSPENHPAGWSGAAVNATMDIAAARHALSAACAWHARLGAAERADRAAQRWRVLLSRLPHYLVNADGALAEWAWPPAGPALPDSYDHRHVSHLYPVWPLHEITVDDTPALADAALRALQLRGAQDGSAHGHLHRALAAARLRDADLAGRWLAAITGGGFFFRSLMSSHYPGHRVYNADAACGLPAVLAEMLVDSVPPRDGRAGRVELLPATAAFLAAGRLRGVRTLTQVGVDLTWDLAAGVAEATLCSRVPQQIELTWRRAAACRATAAGTRSPARTAADQDSGRRRPSASAPVIVTARLRPGSWRLELPAGVPVRVNLEASE